MTFHIIALTLHFIQEKLHYIINRNNYITFYTRGMRNSRGPTIVGWTEYTNYGEYINLDLRVKG